MKHREKKVEGRKERKKWMMREEENRRTENKGDRKRETMWLFGGIWGGETPPDHFLLKELLLSNTSCVVGKCVSKITSDWLRAPTLFWGNMYA